MVESALIPTAKSHGGRHGPLAVYGPTARRPAPEARRVGGRAAWPPKKPPRPPASTCATSTACFTTGSWCWPPTTGARAACSA
ncbi:MAG: hypothetical protein WKG07_16135 [Hymenobacter sp.]